MSTCAALGGGDTAWMLSSETRSTSRQNEAQVEDDVDATSQQDARAQPSGNLFIQTAAAIALVWVPHISRGRIQLNSTTAEKTAKVTLFTLHICSFAPTWKSSKKKSIGV